MTTTSRPTLESVAVGDALPQVSYPVRRFDLVRYAGASGDFNVIHWNPRVAADVGLPDVIAHGMFTMATAGRFVTDWAGDPGAVQGRGRRHRPGGPHRDLRRHEGARQGDRRRPAARRVTG